jgi:hypothetical protein
LKTQERLAGESKAFKERKTQERLTREKNKAKKEKYSRKDKYGLYTKEKDL